MTQMPPGERATHDCIETLRSTIKDGAWADLPEAQAAWYVNHLGRVIDILRGLHRVECENRVLWDTLRGYLTDDLITEILTERGIP
jgi:hypothetical protein